MKRLFIFSGVILLTQLIAVIATGQQDKLSGRWEGKIQALQGERATTAIFKKEGDIYTGVLQGLRPNADLQLKNVKVDGNKVTATAEIEAGQGVLSIQFNLTLQDDSLTGDGNLNFGGQSFTLEVTLKRAAGDAAAAAPPGAQGQAPGAGQQRQRNPGVPQPQQKQSIDYFVGQWTYRYVGRESALGPAPRDCTVTFTKRADGKSVEGVTDCKHDGGATRETSVITFDDATKAMTFTEKLGGSTLVSRADWSSPISIRFTIDPVKVKGQSLQLRRVISVVSAHSFTVTEELSEDGGPFVRLGNAVVVRAEAK